MTFESAIDRHLAVIKGLSPLRPHIETMSAQFTDTIVRGNKILFMGNGGSAADCQHLAAELVVKYKRERNALPALALTVDTSVITAHANDFSFDTVFSRQVEAMARPGDLVVGISTSGNSQNVLAGLRAGLEAGAACWAWTNEDGGQCSAMDGVTLLKVPTRETARVQEALMFVGHWLCEDLDRRLLGPDEAPGN